MQKILYTLLGALLLTTLGYAVWPKSRVTPANDTSSINLSVDDGSKNAAETNTVTTTNVTVAVDTNTEPKKPETNTNTASDTNTTAPVAPDAPSMIMPPMVDFISRVTKKPFGIHITPSTSPIQPEQFSGYHTGADAEMTAAEADLDLAVKSVAAGTVLFAGRVDGYGGVIVIRHTINDEPLLSLYGHLRISSFTVKAGSGVKQGQQLAVLGTGFTSETDGERKHLHFGLIRGTTITYRGYVERESELDAWVDPVAWLQERGL